MTVVTMAVIAIAVAGLMILVGAKRLGARILIGGIILAMAGASPWLRWATATASVESAGLPADSGLLWMAVAGLCLRVLRIGWGGWLLLPAGIRYLVWPQLLHFLPVLPVWAIVALMLLTPVVLSILALRGGQAVLTGIFGRDVAVRVVSRGLVSLLRGFFGTLGRARQQALANPVLPRANAAPFRPHDHRGAP